MCQNLFAIGWARHVFDLSAKAQVPIKNPSLRNQLNNSPTKNILFSIVVVHAQWNLLAVRVQTNRVRFLNRIRQT
jgi:hypothetical protein